jgi:antitoxin MazE6
MLQVPEGCPAARTASRTAAANADSASVLFIAGSMALAAPDHPVLVVDLLDDGKRPFQRQEGNFVWNPALLTAVVADASKRHDLVTIRTELREPQARDQARQVERFQEGRRVFVFHRLVGLDAAVDPAVRDHLPAIHRFDPLHAGNRTAIRSRPFLDFYRDGIHPSPGYVFLAASGIPDHKVTRLSALGHLPVVYRATRSDPVFQLGDVLRFTIHLKYMDLNQGAFPIQMPPCRDAISPMGASATAGVPPLVPAAQESLRKPLSGSRLRPRADVSLVPRLSTLSAACECEAQSALQRLRSTVIPSYTEDVKTAISLPDDTYEQASRRAAELGISRSEFFARAARRYLDELASQSLTQQIDEALRAADDDSSAAAAAAGRSYLAGQDDW